MWRTAGRRLLSAIPLLLGISFVVFLLVDLAPGDPATALAGENPTDDEIAQVRERLGLDQPLLVRYVDWLSGAVRGDLGTSLTTGQSVSGMIWDKVAITGSLVLLALLLTVVIGTTAGVLGSLRPGRLLDRVTTIGGSIAMALPPSWLALVLVVSLAVQQKLFPAVGYAPLADGVGPWLHHLVLPAVVLTVLPAAEVMMQLKASLADSLNQEYTITARAKGLRASSVVLKHALRNAAIPVVTVLGFRAAQLIGGTTVVETVFNLNGLGTMALRSTLGRDVTALLGVVVFAAVVIVVLNLLVDISYGLLNPKVRR